MNIPMIAFDTLKFAKELKAAGLPTEQAEAITYATSEAISHLIEDQMATKGDISGICSDINEIRSDIRDLDSKIQNLYSKMTIRLGSLIVAGIAILAVIIKL